MHQVTEERDYATLTWGMFLILILALTLSAIGPPYLPLVLLALAFAVLFAYRFIYAAFYTAIFLIPFLGIMISVPTGGLLLGQRSFGGDLDVFLVEVAMFPVLAAWAMRLIVLWVGRHDVNWRPKLPLIKEYFFLFFAHVLSIFSSAYPDKAFTLQFSLRPVLFDYLAFIALPVNLIRSKKRLIGALSVVLAASVLAALTGLIAIFFPADPSMLLGRAHPLPIFGVSALGENHNELAEIMVYGSFFAWALSMLVKDQRWRRILLWLGAFQTLIGIMTFTRTFWIVSVLQATFLGLTVWRESAKKYFSQLVMVAILLAPFALGVLYYTTTYTARSSNTTRLSLTEIAWDYFKNDPIFGAGAGSFIQRIGSTALFTIEYGSPLDAHGFIQKLMMETGVLGLAALLLLLVAFVVFVKQGLKSIASVRNQKILSLFIAAAGGAFVYQLFNTDYWTGKMWLPIGLCLAAFQVLSKETDERRE
ncbi:MAG: O-antigen ligase family protein [Patescibacteria group bacterium]|nr:O-antigen ligase family protein [Patescibacteria group bacterium]